MTSAIRSFTNRSLCGLFAAAVLAVGIPTAASADHRDHRGWRGERHYDHGRYRGRDFDHRFGHPDFHRRFRPVVVHRHGPGCSYRPAHRYGYWPVRPFFGVSYRHGVYFGR